MQNLKHMIQLAAGGTKYIMAELFVILADALYDRTKLQWCELETILTSKTT